MIMRKALFVTVRKDSSRLPDKALRKILGVPVLGMIIKRAKLAKHFDEVIVCTTTRVIDDEVVVIAERYGAKVFRGDLNDKLVRWQGAAHVAWWRRPISEPCWPGVFRPLTPMPMPTCGVGCRQACAS